MAGEKLYSQGGFNQMPTMAEWNQYGSYDNERMTARSDWQNQKNYDGFVKAQNNLQASGDIKGYNNNLQLHGLYEPLSSGEQLAQTQFDMSNEMEAARQRRIAEGSAAIDSQFSQFNDAFYNQRRDAYTDWASPQLDTQYQDNTRQLAYALARAGTTNSSSAAAKQADLQRMYGEGKAKLANTGLGYASQARADVAQQKSNLYAQLNATSGAENAASQAAAAAQLGTSSLRDSQPIYDTLGDFFYGLTPGIGQGIGAAGQAAVKGYQNANGPNIGNATPTGNETVRG